MVDIAEFVLARIAEDEAVARAATAGPWIFDGQGFATQSGEPFIRAPYHELDITEEDEAHVVRWRPDRVLAECDAKRRIVERYVKIQGSRQDGDLVERQTLRWIMELHAVAYADHPDYRQEWKV